MGSPKIGLPVPCLQVTIQTGKIEPEICQHCAVLKMCILTMLPKGNFGVSGISAALMREQYIVCRCQKNIPIFRNFFFPVSEALAISSAGCYNTEKIGQCGRR